MTVLVIYTEMESDPASAAAAINAANSNFTVSPEIVAPLLAVVIGLMMVLSFTANSFIVLHTLAHIMTLKQSSVIFLFCLALANLTMSVLFMPFTFIAAAAGHWVFGATPEQKQGVCQFVGFVFGYCTSVSVHTLAVISLDRFLFIVKPMLHKKVMKPWVAWLFVLTILAFGIIFNITPFVGLGQYAFASSSASCLPVWAGNRDYVIYVLVVSTLPLGIIVVTTLWTFIFTRSFIRNHYRSSGHNEEEEGNSVYNTKIRKVFGIFGSLLVVNVISFGPYILISVVGFFVGFGNIPLPAYTTVVVLYLLSNVTIPLVQSLFRRDLKESLSKLKKLTVLFVADRSQFDSTHHSDHTHQTAISVARPSPQPATPTLQRKVGEPPHSRSGSEDMSHRSVEEAPVTNSDHTQEASHDRCT